jgi:hypothetical protein
MSAQDYPLWPQRGLSRATVGIALGLLAVLCLTLLLPLELVIKRNQPPLDLPWFGLGLNSVYILEDGKWIIIRSAYLDRQRRYELEPDGRLRTDRDPGVFTGGLAADVSGGFSPGARMTKLGRSAISIKPGQPYRAWMFSLRSDGDYAYLNPLPADDPLTPLTVTARTVPLLSADRADPKPGTTDPPRIKDEALRSPASGIAVHLNQRTRIEQFVILPGHWFFDISDDVAYIDPYLYFTTDRQRMLHRLRFDEPPGGHAQLTIDRSVPLDIPVDTENSCRIGMDPIRNELFLLRSDGTRYWFDPASLKRTGEDQLPGVWEAEYAQLSLMPGGFNPYAYYGTPLSRRNYERLMQGAMLVFLASLLGLSMLWRPRWNSTSAAATADSSSSAAPESAQSDPDSA